MNEVQSLRFKEMAHDIKSPLAVLDMIVSEVDTLPSRTKKMVLSSIDKIQRIANSILLTTEEKREAVEVMPVLSTLQEIVSEKEIFAKSLKDKACDIKIVHNFKMSVPLYIKVDPTDFNRVISNVINNSIEAINCTGGVISVDVDRSEKYCKIIIKDNGVGVSKDIISRVCLQGFTFGKTGMEYAGSGLGLSHATKMIKSWGGSLKIDSTKGVGTAVTIAIPHEQPPSWQISTLVFNSNQNVVIVDENESVHRLWDVNFILNGVKKHGLKITYLKSLEELKSYIDRRGVVNTTFLIEYKFTGSRLSGIDFIDKYNIQHSSILITNRMDDEFIVRRAIRKGITILPKIMAPVVPIKIADIASHKDTYAAVHIEDDELLRIGWRYKAEKNNKKLLSLESSENILNHLPVLSKMTPFYIDSNLGPNSLRGEEIGKKIYELGFRNIFLTTGHPEMKLKAKSMYWIKGVQGKTPPWK